MYTGTKQSNIYIYLTCCAVYKLMMKKVFFDISKLFMTESVVGNGYYQKESKKNSEEGTYSDEFVDIIHSVMNLVFFVYIVWYILFMILIFKDRKNEKIFK
jgi:heme A synthase